MTLQAGSRLGPYEILALLGAGGMGEVYRVRDERLKRDVAIKVLPASFSSDPHRLKRFEHEAQAAGRLNHPNIAAVYDIGSREGAPYLVSELLILGRDRGVAVWIDETAVSRHHSRIVVADGKAMLEDLGSKNGTYLKGRRFEAAAALSDGDEIRIGPALVRFRALLRRGSTETEERA